MILDTSVIVALLLKEPGWEDLLDVLPFGEPGYVVAIDAYLRFGKGRHPAALNFGDCMAYATAAVTGAPLLWVGDDFAKTDVRRG